MPEQRDALVAKLREDAFREQMREWVEKVREDYLLLHLDPDEADGALGPFPDRVVFWSTSPLTPMDSENNVELFPDMLSQLSEPHIVTAQELTEIFDRYFQPDLGGLLATQVDFDAVYDHFVDVVCHDLVRWRCSNPFRICGLLEESSDDGESTLDEDEEMEAGGGYVPRAVEHDVERRTIWSNGDISIAVSHRIRRTHLATMRPAEPGAPVHTELFVRIVGCISPKALEHLVDLSSRVLPSLIRTIEVIAPPQSLTAPRPGGPRHRQLGAVQAKAGLRWVYGWRL